MRYVEHDFLIGEMKHEIILNGLNGCHKFDVERLSSKQYLTRWAQL